MEYYVYCWVDPRKPGRYCYEGLNFSLLYEPFYVGKGKNKRIHRHVLCYGNNKTKNNLMKYLLKMYPKNEVKTFSIIVNQYLSNDQAIEYEKLYIKTIGKRCDKTGSLTNITDGGEGTSCEPWNKGKKCPQIGRKGRIVINKGKSLIELVGDDEALRIKKKMSDSKKGKPSPHKGKKNPKISERNRTIVWSDEEILKICAEYNAGDGTPTLSNRYERPRAWIEYALKQGNVIKRNKRVKNE